LLLLLLFLLCRHISSHVCFLVPMPRQTLMTTDQPGRSTPQPAPRTDAQSIYVPPVIYPSLVRRPDSSQHEQQAGGVYQEVPASEPDLNRMPARSALKGGKTKEQPTPSVSSPSPSFVTSPLSTASPSKVSSPTVRVTTPIAGLPASRLSNAQQQAHMQQLEKRIAERRSAMESPRPSSATGTPVAFAVPDENGVSRGTGVRFGGAVVEELPLSTSTPPVQSATVQL